MSRIRTVKPEFFLHEELYELEVESGLPIRLAYAGLWCQCDREGRFAWKVRKLKSLILPYDSVSMEAVLSALERAGFVMRYSYDGELWGWCPTFTKHQVINNRESGSIIAPPTEEQAREWLRRVLDYRIATRRRIETPLLAHLDESPQALAAPAPAPAPPAPPPEPEKPVKLSVVKGPLIKPALPPKPPARPKKVKGRAEYPVEFEQFWDECPRKEGKGEALVAWEKALSLLRQREGGKLDGLPPVEWLRLRMVKYAHSPFAKNERPNFLPHPSTWLNQARYDDADDAWGIIPSRGNERAAPAAPQPVAQKYAL